MTRPIANLVRAIRETLEESSSDFHVASWTEADSDGAYLINKDGRMVGIGDYQYGFSHVDDLEQDHPDSISRYARSEAGRIAADMEEVDLDDELDDDEWGISERLPGAFGLDRELVEQKLAEGAVSLAGLFDLACGIPAKSVAEGAASARDNITLTQSIVVARIEEQSDGRLEWVSQVAFNAGDTVGGYTTQSDAIVPFAGGVIMLSQGEFTSAPRSRHCTGPR